MNASDRVLNDVRRGGFRTFAKDVLPLIHPCPWHGRLTGWRICRHPQFQWVGAVKHWHETWFHSRMRKNTESSALWHFPVTAMPDALPELLDPMELLARWQAETELRAPRALTSTKTTGKPPAKKASKTAPKAVRTVRLKQR
ncbi:MAG TPA: hypothetical protein VGF99_11970 [Myxococcota bacterium]